MNRLIQLTLICIMVLLGANASAGIVTKSVEYTHDGVKLEGYLAYDDSTSLKKPGILVVHQWKGLTEYEMMRARMLAEMGYLGAYSVGWVPIIHRRAPT